MINRGRQLFQIFPTKRAINLGMAVIQGNMAHLQDNLSVPLIKSKELNESIKANTSNRHCLSN